MSARLVWPKEHYFDGYLQALRESMQISSNPRHFEAEIREFPQSVKRLLKLERNQRVDTRTYWLVDDGKYIGMVQLRLVLSARFSNIQSSLYYEIRPSKRNTGYGKTIFTLAVAKARSFHLKNLILSCDDANHASKHIIESAGAVLVSSESVPDRSGPVHMYTLAL
jgi:predicted acetyltransferase